LERWGESKMNAEIQRYPDGTYILKVPPEELRIVQEKIREGIELDDRELTIAREFDLL